MRQHRIDDCSFKDAMKEAGIHDGDLLVVDRSLKPSQGRIVVASVDGHLAVRYYRVRRGQAYLTSADEVLPPIPVEPKRGIEIWGVVTSSIHAH